jgi:sugar phosphate permease
VFASIQSLWAGPFLMEFLRLNPITAGNILLMLNLGYSFGAPCGGYVSDKLLKSRNKTVYFAYTIAACAALVLAELHASLSLGLLSGVFFVIGFVNAFNQISFIHAKELMPEQISGSAMTGINFFGMMGAGFFIHGLGLIFDNSASAMGSGAAYSDAFLVCFGAFVAAIICYLPVREPRKTDARR